MGSSLEVPSLLLSDLRRSGSRYQARCPFHHDKNPSLVIFPNTGTYFCFGCEAKGRAVQEGGSYLLYPFGSKSAPSFRPVRQLSKPLEPPPLTRDKKEILSSASLIYYATLHEPEGEAAFSYLTGQRGIHPSVLAQYVIGYANGKTLPSTRAYKDLGLVRSNGEDFFRSSILFPDFDLAAPEKISYLTARGYPDKRHLRPPSSRLKRSSLYLEAFARENKDQLILIEGEIDTLTLRQAGFNATGVPGIHSFNKDDAERLIKHDFRNIIIAFDGDEAGEKGAQKIAELLGDRARILSFPEGFTREDATPIKDWNELFVYHFKKDIRAFRGYFKQQVDLVVSGWLQFGYLEYRGKLRELAQPWDLKRYNSLDACCDGHFREGKKNKGLLGKHFDFKKGEKWPAYREYLRWKSKYYVLTCLSKGTLHDCCPDDKNPWEKHSIFKRCACGDHHHCILCGDTYSREQADRTMEPIKAIADKWREDHPDQPICASRSTITIPQHTWREIDYRDFKEVEDAFSRAIKRYFGGASCPFFINRHFWHSKKPVVVGSILGGVIGDVINHTLQNWWHPHWHITIINLLMIDGKFVWTKPFIDEEKFKILVGEELAKLFELPYEIEIKTRKRKKKKDATYKQFYYIIDGKKCAINLRFNGYVPVDDNPYIVSRGKNKGKEASITNSEYLRGRLRYDCRQPSLDIADYIDKYDVENFTEEEMGIVDAIVKGAPKHWRRSRWRGWLADSIKGKNLAKLDIHIKTLKEKKAELKKEPLLCPVHHKSTYMQFDGFTPKVVFPEELCEGDVILSTRYNQDGRYWIVKNNLYGRDLTSQDLEMHIAPRV